MPSLVVELMQAHKAALLNREQAQMRAMASRWGQLEEELSDQVELFASRVAIDGLTPAQIQSRRFQLDRYRSLLDQVRRELDKYTDYAVATISQGQGEIGRSGIRIAEQCIEATGAENGVRIAFDRLPTEAIEAMVGLAGDGSPLRELLTASYGDGADGMLNQLVSATARGINPRETARLMVRNGLSRSLSRMLNVARTEQLRVGREASRQAYEASGVVESMRRLATKDRRACIACLMSDGELMELDEPLREHPSGRCTTIPVVTGMPLAEWEKGKDWFRKQSPGTQRQILGNEKFDAWERGEIYMEQFIKVRENSTWGDSLQPASLKDMLTDYKPFEIRQPDPNRVVRPIDEVVEEVEEPVVEPVVTPEVEQQTVEYAQQQLFEIRDKYADRINEANELKRQYDSSRDDLFSLMAREDDILRESVGASPEQVKELQKESRQVRKRIKEIQKLRDSYNPQQYKAIYESRSREARDLLKVDNPASNKMHLRTRETAGTITERLAREGLDFFNSMVDSGVMDRIDFEVHRLKNGSRASYMDDFTAINVSDTDGISTFVHEFAHAIEYKNPSIQARVREWREKRTQGESYQSLRSLAGGSYRNDEEAKPDRFIVPYIGKNNGARSSEVVSVGLQYMYEDPILFAERDPDMFGFIYDLVRNRDTSKYGGN